MMAPATKNPNDSAVSVILTACQGTKSDLEKTLKSLSAQTLKDWELWVIDDVAQQSTAEIVLSFAGKDPRIQYLAYVGGNTSQARNRGLQLCKGPWLHFIEAGLTIVPDFYERMVQEGDRAQADLVSCLSSRKDKSGNVVFSSREPFALGSDNIDVAALATIPIHAILLKRELAVNVGGFDPLIKTCAVWEFWIRAAAQSLKFTHIGKSLALYENTPPSHAHHVVQTFVEILKLLEHNSQGFYAEAFESEEQRSALYTRLYLWFCGFAAAQGAEIAYVRRHLPAFSYKPEAREAYIDTLYEGLSMGYGQRHQNVASCWPFAEWAIQSTFEELVGPEQDSLIKSLMDSLTHKVKAASLSKLST